MNRFVKTTTVMLTMCAATTSSGQLFTRSDEINQVNVTLSVGAEIQNVDSDGEDFIQSGDLLVGGSATASVEDSIPPATASVDHVALGSAQNLTPLNGTTLLPTVDVSLVQSQIVTAEGQRADTLEATGNGVGANGNYTLDGGATTGFLRGSIYLVGLVNQSASGDGTYNAQAQVEARVEGFGATATFSEVTDLWTVNVNLPDSTLNYTTAGANEFFTFVIPVSLPLDVNLISNATAADVAVAGQGGGGTMQVQTTLSASAWAQFTPTADPPPEGDFDGDGDVDGSDFLTWQRGVEEPLGATQSEGDADHDGLVGGSDLAAWESNFGTSFMSSSKTVPEPTSVVLCMLGLFTVASLRLFARQPC